MTEDIIPNPWCFFCKHLIECDFETGRFTCHAFPDGIPAEIALGNNDHSKPYPGDRGIRYEPRDKIDEDETDADEGIQGTDTE